MSIARKLMPAVALPLVLAACGDDVVGPGNELTEEESVALLRGMGAMLFDDPDVIHQSLDSVVLGCPQGGRATAVGKPADEEFVGDTIRLVFDFQITPTGCQVTGEGMQFTVDGDPGFRYVLRLESIASTGEYYITGSISGGVEWQHEDRSGTCPMDLTLEEAEVVGETLTGAFRGTMCGHEVDIDAAGLVPGDL